MEVLKKLLDAECPYRMEAGTMDRFLGLMTELEFRRKELIIPYGGLDSSIYVVRKGIVRAAYFDGFKEVTFAFGLPGGVTNYFFLPLRQEIRFLLSLPS